MKILVLIITITWSFGGGYQNRPTYEIVNSPEEAAIYIYRDRQFAAMEIEPDHKEYELFEVDLKNKTITVIDIPEISFKRESPKL